jgi:membrane protein DedA with SNARE-associated domain
MSVSIEVLGWYASIFFWLYFTGLGVPPCPEEAGILYAAGVTALHPEVVWWLAWPATSAGIVCADTTLYAIGRLWGQGLLNSRWGRWLLKPERRVRIQQRFAAHGIKILVAARFLPPLRTGVFIIAGTIHYSFVNFLIADAVFAVVGVGLFFFCSTWLIDLVNLAGHWLVFAVVAAVVVYALYRYYRYLRRREVGVPMPPPPVSVLQLAGTSAPAAGPQTPSAAPGASP